MSRKLVECVPNFSEGRDASKFASIVAAIAAVPGAVVLSEEMDADHNRGVVTFVAPPETVVEAALAGAARAAEVIDLTTHRGAHPRIGATDVMPFVPLEGVTLEECAELAGRAATLLWKRHQIPSYLYEAAARRPDRVNLENIRRGQFELLLTEAVENPDRAPDVGGPALHPTAGATVIGARKFLIAYNINLHTSDVTIAQRIAKSIRHSSGGFRFVKAMGVMLTSRNQAQVSMNLTDFESTPVHRVFECVRSEAARYGVNIAGSEIIGLIPKKALEMAADFYLQFENFTPELVIENRLGGRSGLDEFLDRLAAPTPTPGGGSASAAAAAMSAALGAMVARLSKLDPAPFESDRAFFSAAVERDSDAYQAVVKAYKVKDETKAMQVEKAMQQATLVPLEVLERAHALAARLSGLNAPSKFSSDVATARAFIGAAQTGARANVDINFPYLTDESFKAAITVRLRDAG